MLLQITFIWFISLVTPAIIVLGSGFEIIIDEREYKEETEKAANEGYDELMVIYSVINLLINRSSNGEYVWSGGGGHFISKKRFLLEEEGQNN